MVKKEKDFNKVKLKVGRKIKKQNETIVDVKRKKIILPRDKVPKQSSVNEKSEFELLDSLIESLNSSDCNVVVNALETIFNILKPFVEQISDSDSFDKHDVILETLFGNRKDAGQFAFQPGNLLGNILRIARTKDDNRLGIALCRISTILFKIIAIKSSKLSAAREIFLVAITMFNRSENYYKWNAFELVSSISNAIFFDDCNIFKFICEKFVIKMLAFLTNHLSQCSDTKLSEERRSLYLRKADIIFQNMFDAFGVNKVLPIHCNAIDETRKPSQFTKPDFSYAQLSSYVDSLLDFEREDLNEELIYTLYMQHLLLFIRVLNDFNDSSTEYNMKRIYWITNIVNKLILRDSELLYSVKKNKNDKKPLIDRVLKSLFAIAPFKNWNNFAEDIPLKVDESQSSKCKIIYDRDMSKRKRKFIEKRNLKLTKRSKLDENVEEKNIANYKMAPLAHFINQNILRIYANSFLKGIKLDTFNFPHSLWRESLFSALIEDTTSQVILWSWIDCFDSFLLDPIRLRNLKDLVNLKTYMEFCAIVVEILDEILSKYLKESQADKPFNNKHFLRCLAILICYWKNLSFFLEDSDISKKLYNIFMKLGNSTEYAQILIDNYLKEDATADLEWRSGLYNLPKSLIELDTKYLHQIVF